MTIRHTLQAIKRANGNDWRDYQVTASWNSARGFRVAPKSVCFTRDEKEARAYYTNDSNDAIKTAASMRENLKSELK